MYVEQFGNLKLIKEKNKMILVKPNYEILSIMNSAPYDNPLRLIELAGRTCYKSEDKITNESTIIFVEKINDLGHESVLEHSAMSVKFICDRGVSHELVRHRLCSFSQESTRYCNYKGGVTFVIPPWINIPEAKYNHKNIDSIYFFEPNSTIDVGNPWASAMAYSEETYIELLDDGWSPQQARSVLPNSLKTEIVVTANFREWKHIFKLRTSKAAHPQMREIMIPLLNECKKLIPVIFDNIKY